MNLDKDVARFDLAASQAEHINRDRATELKRAEKVSLKERKQMAKKMAADEKETNKKKQRAKDDGECDGSSSGEDDVDGQVNEDEADNIRVRDKLRDDEWESRGYLIALISCFNLAKIVSAKLNAPGK